MMAGTRPQTLYGLADSPIALAACMLDHDDGLGQPGLVQQALEGRTERPSDLTRDDILDNITLYWLTNTGVSSPRLYWEYKGGFFAAKGVTIPVGRQRLPRRALPGSAELGRAGLPQPHPLQRARQGRPLRRLGTAGAALRGGPRGVPVAAVAHAPARGRWPRRPPPAPPGARPGTHTGAKPDRAAGSSRDTIPTRRTAMTTTPSLRGTTEIRPFTVRSRGGARRPAPAHRRDALAQQGARRRPLAGRAAGDDAGARPLLGDRATTGASARRG